MELDLIISYKLGINFGVFILVLKTKYFIGIESLSARRISALSSWSEIVEILDG
jgi:predicted transporter